MIYIKITISAIRRYHLEREINRRVNAKTRKKQFNMKLAYLKKKGEMSRTEAAKIRARWKKLSEGVHGRAA